MCDIGLYSLSFTMITMNIKYVKHDGDLIICTITVAFYTTVVFNYCVYTANPHFSGSDI